MHDVQDGPASTEAWLATLEWEGGPRFRAAPRQIVRARDTEDGCDTGSAEGSGAEVRLPGGGGSSPEVDAAASVRRLLEREAGRHGPPPAAAARVVAYWRRGGGLTHAVLTGAGHMTPRDDPLTTRWMLERWLAAEQLLPGAAGDGGDSDDGGGDSDDGDGSDGIA